MQCYFLPQLMFVNSHWLLEIVLQPYIDSSSTVPLRDVRCSYTEDVVGMEIILLRNRSVPELVQVRSYIYDMLVFCDDTTKILCGMLYIVAFSIVMF